MCHRCDAEREYLVSIEQAALWCRETQGTTIPMVMALVMEETDQEVARHLSFLYLDTEDSDEAVEDTLIGSVYLNVLGIKAKLQ